MTADTAGQRAALKFVRGVDAIKFRLGAEMQEQADVERCCSETIQQLSLIGRIE